MKTKRPLTRKLNLCPHTFSACELAEGRRPAPAPKRTPGRELDDLVRALRRDFRYEPDAEPVGGVR